MDKKMNIPRRLPTYESFMPVYEDSSDEPKKDKKVKDTSADDFLKYFKDESNFTMIQNPKYTPEEVIDIIGGEDAFKKNYSQMRMKSAEGGLPKRSEMPVIHQDQVERFAKDLESGNIDVFKPYADGTDVNTSGRFDYDKFPPYIKDKSGFLTKGKEDGNVKDDVINIKKSQIPVGNLKPSQDEIYGSKIAYNLLKYGPSPKGSTAHGGNVIMSQDSSGSEGNRILDGHHRWATAYVSSPDVKMKGLQIELPFRPALLAIGRSYGNAIGNNQQA